MMDRRQFLTSSGTLLAGTLAPSFASGAEPFAEKPLRILFFTDIHAIPENGVPAALELAAAQMNAQKADLLICGGDSIHRGYLSTVAESLPRFAVYGDFVKRLSGRVEPVIGNHDLAGARPVEGEAAADPRALWKKENGLSNTWRSFDFGGWHFVILDTVELVEGATVYRGWVGDDQMAWLDADLAAISENQPVVLISHIPFRTTFLQVKTSPETALPINLCVGNGNEVLAKFEKRNLRLILQGHLHVNESIRWNDQPMVMAGAVCGAWWKGPNMGTPPGFSMIDLHPEKIDFRYVPFDPPIIAT